MRRLCAGHGWPKAAALLAMGVLSGCAGVGQKGSDPGRYFHAENPERAIIAEADEFNFDYKVADLDGRRVGGQVFDDGRYTYFVAPKNGDFEDLRDSAGAKRDSSREGMYRVVEDVQSMWFATKPDGQHVCVRAGWMSANACKDAVNASQGGRPARAELEYRRQELLERLEALEAGK